MCCWALNYRDINIGSSSDLVSWGTKSPPEPMLTKIVGALYPGPMNLSNCLLGDNGLIRLVTATDKAISCLFVCLPLVCLFVSFFLLFQQLLVDFIRLAHAQTTQSGLKVVGTRDAWLTKSTCNRATEKNYINIKKLYNIMSIHQYSTEYYIIGYYCFTRNHHWLFNSLWPSESIRHQTYWLTLIHG